MSVTTAEARPIVIRTAPLFFVNSVLAAIVGVVAARMVHLLSIGVTAAVAGRRPVLTNSEVVFRAPGSEAVDLAGIVGSLTIGLALLVLYPGSRDRSVGRLTMLWTMLFCFQGGLTSVAAGAVDETSVLGGLLADLDPPSWVGSAVALVSLLLLCGIAVGTAPAFLSFARHWSEVSTKAERARFVGLLAVAPGLAGPMLAFPMFVPGAEMLPTLPFAGWFVAVTFVASLFTTSFRPPEVVEERTLSFGLIAAVALVAVLMRLGISPGVPLPPWNESLDLTFRP